VSGAFAPEAAALLITDPSSLIADARPGWKCATARIESTARPSEPAATSRSAAVPNGIASCDASQGPAIAPNVPPTAITPKSRLLCSSEKRSTIRAQKTIVAKKLNTLNQTKKTIPLASPMAAGANTNRAKNTSRLAAKKR
jgi:hypothetical protein